MVENGYIKRIRNGVYAFNEWRGKQGIYLSSAAQVRMRHENAVFSGNGSMQAVLFTTENFSYCDDGMATIEKAFVDLYFAVTRNDYPLSLQELVRIYQNLSRLGNIDKKKMVTVATKRNMQYDIRFIAESRFITDQAIRFVEILRREGCVDYGKLFHEESAFQRQAFQKRMEDFGFKNMTRMELFLWDLELFLHIQKILGDK